MAPEVPITRRPRRWLPPTLYVPAHGPSVLRQAGNQPNLDQVVPIDIDASEVASICGSGGGSVNRDTGARCPWASNSALAERDVESVLTAEHDRPAAPQVEVDACPEARRYFIISVHGLLSVYRVLRRDQGIALYTACAARRCVRRPAVRLMTCTAPSCGWDRGHVEKRQRSCARLWSLLHDADHPSKARTVQHRRNTSSVTTDWQTRHEDSSCEVPGHLTRPLGWLAAV